jgi:anaerobic selenocysteine-containing dehydrogenase
MRQGRPGIRGAFVQFEARMTTTGASADEWVPVTPGTEGVVALGIAHLILKEQSERRDIGRFQALIDGWAGGLTDYGPEQVAARTGVPRERLERLARQFMEIRPSVAIVGGPPLAHTNGLFTALAVNALNALAGSVGAPGGLFFTPRVGLLPSPRDPERQSLETLVAAMRAGTSTPKVLFVDQANPVFTTPPAWKVRDALAAVPFIVSFASFVDDTSVLADVVLPDHSFLESWTDAIPESGSMTAVASVAAPAMKPLFQTRATPDVLLELGRRLRSTRC